MKIASMYSGEEESVEKSYNYATRNGGTEINPQPQKKMTYQEIRDYLNADTDSDEDTDEEPEDCTKYQENKETNKKTRFLIKTKKASLN